MDWDTALYDPLYSVFAVTAAIDTGSVQASVKVIDETGGIEITRSDVDLPVISPAVFVRTADLMAASLTEEALLDASLTFNGRTWTIKNCAPKPGPGGKGSGEVMLLLANGDL